MTRDKNHQPPRQYRDFHGKVEKNRSKPRQDSRLESQAARQSRIDEITERLATTEVVMPSVGLRPYSALQFMRRFYARAASLCPLLFPLLSATSLIPPNLAARRCAWGHPIRKSNRRKEKGKGHIGRRRHFPRLRSCTGCMHRTCRLRPCTRFLTLGDQLRWTRIVKGPTLVFMWAFQTLGDLRFMRGSEGLGKSLACDRLSGCLFALPWAPRQPAPGHVRGESHRLARLVERLRLDRLSINGLKELDIAAHGSGGGGDQEHPDEHKGCAGRSECDPSQAGHSGNRSMLSVPIHFKLSLSCRFPYTASWRRGEKLCSP